MFKACIFDLDGTLADTLESMASVANEIMRKYSLKELPVENFKYYCGEGASVLIRRCLADAGDPDLCHYEEAEKLYRERFNEDPLYKVTHYEGMQTTIRELKARGARLAVCTNKPHLAAEKVISELFPGDFDMVLGQSEAIRRKPAPDGPLKAAAEFGVRPEECLYIGDTSTDMKTGRAAGMYTVGVLWGFRTRQELEENKADVIIGKPEELINIYERGLE